MAKERNVAGDRPVESIVTRRVAAVCNEPERRRYARACVRRLVSYWSHDQRGIAWLVDISPAGLRLRALSSGLEGRVLVLVPLSPASSSLVRVIPAVAVWHRSDAVGLRCSLHAPQERDAARSALIPPPAARAVAR